MKIVFVSGPYRANTINGILENIFRARRIAVELWKKGYVAFCPHLNSLLMDGIAEDEIFLEGDLVILERCDAIYMMAGWEKSEGARKELEFAKQNGLEIIYEAP